MSRGCAVEPSKNATQTVVSSTTLSFRSQRVVACYSRKRDEWRDEWRTIVVLSQEYILGQDKGEYIIGKDKGGYICWQDRGGYLCWQDKGGYICWQDRGGSPLWSIHWPLPKVPLLSSQCPQPLDRWWIPTDRRWPWSRDSRSKGPKYVRKIRVWMKPPPD